MPKNRISNTPKTAGGRGHLHPRNVHQGRYDFEALTQTLPKLAAHTISNPNGQATIDFSDHQAVRVLNQALLAHHYGIKFWDIPDGYLCPPIPGRADYIHYVADLLAQTNHHDISTDIATAANTDKSVAITPPTGKGIHALDIGTGASAIYPIIGSSTYGWRFTASDIDPISVNTATLICQANPALRRHVRVVRQPDATCFFTHIIRPQDHIDVVICNPPFHASPAEARAASTRKQRNLHRHRANNRANNHTLTAPQEAKPTEGLNFGGQQGELWCHGGEVGFVTAMINESQSVAHQVGWFTSLVSKAEHLTVLQQRLAQLGASDIRVINMQQGQKISRILAWRFGSEDNH